MPGDCMSERALSKSSPAPEAASHALATWRAGFADHRRMEAHQVCLGTRSRSNWCEPSYANDPPGQMPEKGNDGQAYHNEKALRWRIV